MILPQGMIVTHRALKNIGNARELVQRLLSLSENEPVFVLDGGGARPDANRLIAGIRPSMAVELDHDDPRETLSKIELAARRFPFCFFTLSYELGRKLQRIGPPRRSSEPDAYLFACDSAVVHDYETGVTSVAGDARRIAETESLLRDALPFNSAVSATARLVPEESRGSYGAKVERVRELIRSGLTYQTNLTQRFSVDLPEGPSPAVVFLRLREAHPAPFAAYATRSGSTVVSASPERFFSLRGRSVTASPIKGTRPRSADPLIDAEMRRALSESEKDRAENVMIVDLLRNDLGRVCEYGSVRVAALCEIEDHPSLFHMVSTIEGRTREETGIAALIGALFPCGSITGAPKISTMRIIDELEPVPRGLSMGAIGYFARDGLSATPGSVPEADLSVAIRTLVARGGRAEFNVGGGIVIDSDPEDEYLEALAKATALADALGVSAQLRELIHPDGV
jgi:para-aminobenzoate synthetase component 1